MLIHGRELQALPVGCTEADTAASLQILDELLHNSFAAKTPPAAALQQETRSEKLPVFLPLPVDSPADALAQIGQRIDAALTAQAHLRNIWRQTDLVFTTSGSTSEHGKLVAQTLEALTCSAAATWRYLQAAPPPSPDVLAHPSLEPNSEPNSAPKDILNDPTGATWILALPPQYIGGFQVLLRTALGKYLKSPVKTQLYPCFAPGPQFAAAFAAVTARALKADSGPLYTSLVPAQLARIMADQTAAAAAAKYQRILVGAAACPPELLHAARVAGLRITTTYGASETAGGLFYDGLALPTTPPIRAHLDADRHLTLQSPTLFLGYLSGEESSLENPESARSWRSSDLARWQGNRLEILGRADQIINSGGVKIMPSSVQEILERHPQITQAVVTGVPDPIWGQRVAGIYTGTTPLTQSQRLNLETQLRRDLGSPALPRPLLWVQQIPLLPSGKADLRRISQLLQEKQ